MNSHELQIKRIFPACCKSVSADAWSALFRRTENEFKWENFPGIINSIANELDLPEYLNELAELEAAMESCREMQSHLPGRVEQKMLNPSLRILNLNWQGLTRIINSKNGGESVPRKGAETILIWFDPGREKARAQRATNQNLLALKIASEGLHIGRTALEHGANVAGMHRAMDQAQIKGLILGPETLLARDQDIFKVREKAFQRFLQPGVFTLQWHITQACDLNCKHCYDRSSRKHMPFEQAFTVLDELEQFCSSKNVRAKVTFTGGNPLLYPRFNDLYLETVRRGFPVSILGNPASRQRIEELAAIQTPSFYQLSLEGLPEHNDFVRQQGYFDRVMDFLPILKDLGIRSQIMLTLTSENMDQVLPLGEILRGKTDIFTFNRLSAVGEGANLLMPDPDDYQAFLREYMRETEKNPVLGLKDNLINTIRDENRCKPFGGCTGFGCGAGFNFLTLLSDGEIHACRKFPSYMGNIFQEGLVPVYNSPAGRKYRAGSASCRGCGLLPACGGCQAVIFSTGLDPSRDRDPYCFYKAAP